MDSSIVDGQQTLITDHKAVIAIIALVANILITGISLWLNNVWFNQRRTNEREYNQAYNLFKIAIIDQMKAIIGFSCDVKVLYDQLLASVENESSRNRETVEKYLEKLDKAFAEIRFSVLPSVQGYSISMHKELFSIVEKFYDECSAIFGKFSVKAINHEMHRNMGNMIVNATSNYIQGIFRCVKGNSPSS